MRLRAPSAAALFLGGLVLAGCSSGADGTSGNERATARPETTVTASSSAAPRPITSVAPPVDSATKLFEQPAPKDVDPVAIHAGNAPSGVILFLPRDFGSRVSLGGEGLTSMRSLEPGTASAHLRARIGATLPREEPAASELDAACDPTWFSGGTWARGADVAFAHAPHARVWKGRGVRKGTPNAREAWVAMAAIEMQPAPKVVVVCGSWDPAHPELEAEIALVLSTMQRGEAPPNDVNGL